MEYVYAILPWLLIFGVFWFFLIRPQQKKQKAHKDMIDNLQIGRKIVTIGGIKGKIVKIKEDHIRLRISSNVDIDIVNNAIGRLDETEIEAEESSEEKKEIEVSENEESE